MKVLEKNQTKVLETEKLLLEIIKEPLSFKDDAALFSALKSQSAIAKYENLERQIVSCSLNTMKSISEALLERGYVRLDELRKSAKTVIEGAQYEKKSGRPNKQTASGLKLKVEELEGQLDAMRFACFNLTTIVNELRSHAKQIAEHNGTVEQRIELYQDKNTSLELKLSHIQQSNDFEKFLTEYKRFLDARS